MRPLLEPHLLQDHQATLAENCWNRSGSAEPIPVRRDLDEAVPSTTRSLYRFSDTQWFVWDEDVDVVRAPVVEDTVNRTIWTGESYPRFTSTVILGSFISPGTPANVRRLGIPAPTDAPITAAQSQSDTDSSVASEFHVWVYTYVSDLGEEGAPSPASAVVERTFDTSGEIQTVEVTMATGPTSSNHGITRKRLYRTATGTSGATTFQFVVDLAVETATYDDSLETDELGEGLSTADYAEPPADLTGVVSVGNAFLAGFVGRDVYFCEPYQPHAWPAEYVQNVPFDVVGLEVFGTEVTIMTTGGAWIAAGSHPDSLGLRRVELVKGCVGKRTITPIGEQGIAYAAPDGLILVGPGGSRMVTLDSWGEDDWKALGMENAIATYHEGWYLAFLADKAVAIDPRTGEGYEFDDDASAVYLDHEADEVYLVIEGAIEEFRSQPESGVVNRTMRWRSKAWRGRLRSPGAYQVFGEVDSLKLLDPAKPDTTFATLTPSGNASGRTPDDLGLHCDIGFEITGDEKVTEVRVGEMGEMLD